MIIQSCNSLENDTDHGPQDDEQRHIPAAFLDSVQELRQLDIVADPSIDHSRMVQLTRVILSFLEQATKRLEQEFVDSSVFAGIQELCQHQVIEKLLALRWICHQIAADENPDGDIAVVTCVDDIFSRMGRLLHLVVGHYPEDGSVQSGPLDQESFTLGGHREQTSLRAALQLPHTLPQLISIIESDHASVAVIRLAIRIVFSTTVLQCSPGSEISVSLNCHTALRVFLSNRGMELGATDHPTQALEDKVVIAMALSTFAMFDLLKMDELYARFRPHTQAIMLEHIARVFRTDASDGHSLNAIEPVLRPDASQMLLTEWGVAVPWCWAVWNDDRCAGYDVILSLTTTWLYHLGDHPPLHRIRSWQEELELCIAYGPTNAILCFINILRRVNEVLMGDESPSRLLSIACLRVLLRCCWGVKEILYVLDDTELIQSGAAALCRLFILIQDTKEGLIVKDCIIAALAGIDPNTLRSVIKEAAEDAGLRASEKLNAGAAVIIRNLCSTDASIRNADCGFRIKQLLQFITLVWQVDGCITAFIHLQSISSILRITLQDLHRVILATHTVERESRSSLEAGIQLLHPLLTAVAAMVSCERRGIASDAASIVLEPAKIWEVAITRIAPTDLVAIAAFTSYVAISASGKEEMQSIIGAATWDLLRDYVILVLQGHFVGTPEEGLSYVLCISVCETMIELLQNVPGIASPWTRSLGDNIQRLRIAAQIHGLDAVNCLQPSLERLAQSTIQIQNGSLQDTTKRERESLELDHFPYYMPVATRPEVALRLILLVR